MLCVTSSFLLLVMPGATSSFLLLVSNRLPIVHRSIQVWFRILLEFGGVPLFLQVWQLASGFQETEVPQIWFGRRPSWSKRRTVPWRLACGHDDQKPHHQLKFTHNRGHAHTAYKSKDGGTSNSALHLAGACQVYEMNKDCLLLATVHNLHRSTTQHLKRNEVYIWWKGCLKTLHGKSGHVQMASQDSNVVHSKHAAPWKEQAALSERSPETARDLTHEPACRSNTEEASKWFKLAPV